MDVYVVKITKESGNEVRRNMTLPKSTWDYIIEHGSGDSNVTYELRKSEVPNIAPKKLIDTKAKEVSLSAKEEKKETKTAPERKAAETKPVATKNAGFPNKKR